MNTTKTTPLQRLTKLAALQGDETRDETDRYQVPVYLGDVRALLAVVAVTMRFVEPCSYAIDMEGHAAPCGGCDECLIAEALRACV